MSSTLIIRRHVSLACTIGASLLPLAAVAAGAPAASGDPDQLEEVVVTATKRSESIDKVALSVTAVSQSSLDLQGFKSVQDLARTVPSLTFRALPGSAETNIAIRGVYSTVGAPTTGIYLDDAPLQKRNAGAVLTGNGAPLPSLFDLERIEVLRGPQGTLYGGSSEGGTIRLITPTPSLTTYSGYGRAEVNTVHSGGEGYEIGGALGGPLVQDMLGFRLSLWGQRTAGWVDDVSQDSTRVPVVLAKDVNDGKNAVGRLAFLYAPTEQLTIAPTVFYSYGRRGDSDTYTVNPDVVVPGFAPFTQFGPYRKSSNYYTIDGVETPYENPKTSTLFVPSVGIDYQLPSLTVHSSTSYVHDKTYGVSGTSGNDYLTFSPTPVPFVAGGGINGYQDFFRYSNDREVFSQEIRLSSGPDSGAFSWVLGGFYSRGEGSVRFRGTFEPSLDVVSLHYGGPPVLFIFGAPGDTPMVSRDDYVEKSLAGFGEVSYAFTEKWKATVGARVSSEKLYFNNLIQGLYVGTTVATAENGGLTSGKQDDTPVTPKVSLSYQVTPEDLIYVTAAKGFRTGGINTPPAEAFTSPVNRCYPDLQALGGAPPSTYDSDSLWSYEAGAKLRMFDNRVRLSGAVYYIDWSDVQTQITFPACGYTYTANIPGAEIKGVDLEAELRVVDPLTVNLTLSHVQAQYSRTVMTPSGSGAILVKGDELPIPKWSGSVGATYRVRLTDRVDGYVRADAQYSASWHATGGPASVFYNPSTYEQNDSTLVSLRAGVRFDGFDVSLFSDNLFDTHRALLYSTSAQSIFASETAPRPRTIGLTVTTRF